jgi:hypothetical protein
MQINKSTIYHIGNRLFFWTLINFSFNLFGLWFSKIILKENFIFPESIQNEFIIPILIQSLLFGVCFGTAFIFLKNKKFSWLAFGVVQFFALHIAFFSGIKFVGGLHFETSIAHVGLRYLSYQGQYLIDFIFTNKPLSGNFDNGLFKPDSTSLFYLIWVFSISAYYLVISWFNEQLVLFFTSNKTKNEVNNEVINDN